MSFGPRFPRYSTGNNISPPATEQALNEELLVAAAKRGDQQAFGQLTACHTAKLLRTTLRITKNREDAEDAVQESLTRAFVHLASFDGRARFSTWLTRIAINAALGSLRKNRQSREVSIAEQSENGGMLEHYELRADVPNPEECCVANEHLRILNDAVVRLQPKLREIYEVHQLGRESLHQTAKTLGISTTAVKSRLFRARVELRRSLRIRTMHWQTSSNPGTRRESRIR
jgi:RNA polymerase sigma-70 factor (ECF subfamily)